MYQTGNSIPFTCNTIYKKRIAELYRFPDIAVSEDVMFNIKLYQAGETFLRYTHPVTDMYSPEDSCSKALLPLTDIKSIVRAYFSDKKVEFVYVDSKDDIPSAMFAISQEEQHYVKVIICVKELRYELPRIDSKFLLFFR